MIAELKPNYAGIAQNPMQMYSEYMPIIKQLVDLKILANEGNIENQAYTTIENIIKQIFATNWDLKKNKRSIKQYVYNNWYRRSKYRWKQRKI